MGDSVGQGALSLPGSHGDGSGTVQDGQVIRLVELYPGETVEQVSVRLFVSELETAPKYDALSYVWGDPTKRTPIICNGHEFQVTVNLNEALKSVRSETHSITIWADAICINQLNTEERSHHVSFMGDIYRNADKVLVCLGKAPEGDAQAAKTLVGELAAMIAKYSSILEMPVLAANDKLYDDPRWKSIYTLHKLPWFERAWVIQEVGLAKDPRILYGGDEFSYRDLMRLASWSMRCAPNLDTKVNVSFFSVHTDWLDWSEEGIANATYSGETLVDLFNQARWLSCSDPRDHVYSLLGHPFARPGGKPEAGLIIDPDYKKDHMDVWFDLAVRLIPYHGLRILSPVEHNEQNLDSDYPSWIPWCWNEGEEYTSCTLGAFYDFFYAADGGMHLPPSKKAPSVGDARQLHVQGLSVDTVKHAIPFTNADLTASPEKLRAMLSNPPRADEQSSSGEPQMGLVSVWKHVQELVTSSSTIYNDEWLTAFSLTLIAGITTYMTAEDNLPQHRSDFAAYFHLWLNAVYGSEWTRWESLLAGLVPSQVTVKSESGSDTNEPIDDSAFGDAEKYFVDMKLMCEGRSFFFTEKGYFGLGSWIAKPGDKVSVLFGAKCPFLFRDGGAGDDSERRWKLVQDAYVHGLMRGEAVERMRKGEFAEESFTIC